MTALRKRCRGRSAPASRILANDFCDLPDTDYSFWSMRLHPELESLREHPRYEALLAQHQVRVPW